MPQRFSYARSIAPMLWVVVALSSIELLVVHLLIAHWSHAAAVALSIVTLGAMGWLVAAILSFDRRRVIVDDAGIDMRAGWIKRVHVPAGGVAGVRTDFVAADIRGAGILNLALVAFPNIVVDLRAPVRYRGRVIDAVAHRLDDPTAFVRAVDALVAGR